MSVTHHIELQLDKILCLTLGLYPSTNSCKYKRLLSTGLKKKNERYDCFKIEIDLKTKQKICDVKMTEYAPQKIKRHFIKNQLVVETFCITYRDSFLDSKVLFLNSSRLLM